jgi:hypothetical protein
MQVYTNGGIKSVGQLSSHLPNAEYRGWRIKDRRKREAKEEGNTGFILSFVATCHYLADQSG